MSWPILGVVLAFVRLKRFSSTVGGRPGPSSRASAGGFLPVLLIVAVLLCDGILGFTHQVLCDACEPTVVSKAHHGSVTGVGETGSGHTGDGDTWGGLESHSYAAILLATFGAALLGLLLGVRRWRDTGARRLVFRQHYPQVFALRPRGPTLPSLQVFRL